MGKRSTFARRKNDAYDTPEAPVLPLLPFLAPETRFCEPCAGRGDLIRHLESAGHVCVEAWDVEPGADGIQQIDALGYHADQCEAYITNPPWTREILHPLIVHLSAHRPTWLLFDADWMHTAQAAPLLPRCPLIVTVGRVKWIPDSLHTGKDNAAWFLFDARHSAGPHFHGRPA